MRRTLSFAVLISLLLASNAWAQVWYVKPDSTGAVINIQAGIDSCGAGDTVVAMPGVYQGTGNWDLDFRGKPIVVMSASRHDPTITDSTVIDGDLKHRGFHFHSGETNASILEGFSIAHCSYPCECGEDCYCFAYPGGGILCDSASSPVIRYNKISNCWGRQGGGISCSRFSAPIVANNEISGCLAIYGTAICCSDSSAPVISNNKIHHCPGRISGEVDVAGYAFGHSIPVIDGDERHIYDMSYYWAILCDGSSPLIMNNTITDLGYTPNGGVGAICCSGCPSCTIIGNKTYRNHGGIFLFSCSATIKGNEIEHNQGADYGLIVWSSTAMIAGNSIHENISGGDAVSCWYSSATIDSNYIHGNGYLVDGVYSSYGIEISDSKAIIRYNDISSNTNGGITYYGDSTGTIENNRIADNGHAQPRGGIQCSSPVDIVGNTIKNNVSSYGGGGITCHASASIRNNVIVSNSCFSHKGGGIFCDGSSPSIINNTIVGNMAGRGSGICVGAQSHPILSCNIISDNRLYECEECDYYEYRDGGGIYSESDSVAISCCDVYDNQGGNYIGLADQTGHHGNFSADPIFCDASYGNYSLHVESPCLPGNHPNGSSCELIGAAGRGCEYIATLLQEHHEEVDASGIAISWKLAEVGGHMSFLVLRAEMPSTEYQEIPAVSISSEGVSFSFRDVDCKPGATYRYRVDISNSNEASRSVLFETDPIVVSAARLTLHQNFPNPFNPSTSIRYELPVKTAVAVEIYDVSGGRVARLVDGEEERGPHVAEWRGLDDRGRPVASGVYFYRLTAGKETISKKMVLLR